MNVEFRSRMFRNSVVESQSFQPNTHAQSHRKDDVAATSE